MSSNVNPISVSIVESCPQQSAQVSADVDLMITEEVIADDIVVEDVGEEVIPIIGRQQQPKKLSKILVTLSDDLSYTLAIDGNDMSAVMDSIAADEYMKNEWNSWQRFISNPNQFFVYIFDNDFKEYVRYRSDIPIRHLTKLKIKNKFYVNQLGVKNCYQQLISRQSAAIDDVFFDTEPTDALIGDQNNNSSCDQNICTTITEQVEKHNNKSISTDIISHNALNASQYHHNYHMSSPSAPTSHLISSSCLTEPVPSTTIDAVLSTPTEAVPSTPTSPPITAPTIRAETETNRSINSSQTTKPTTKAAKKLFNTDPELLADPNKSNSSETDSLSGDLLADAPTGPTFDWSQEQTITFLNLCKPFSKELAPKHNVLCVKQSVWEQLSKELNSKDSGHSFDPLMCRNHFSRLRLTYTNVLLYPGLRDETRWPYFELMKEIIGEKPEEIQSKVKTRAQSQTKAVNTGQPSPGKAIRKSSHQNKKFISKQQNSVSSVMKNSANQEVSVLYIALLNLVKKYIKYFETEKKNSIWSRIETEMRGAGFKWSATALRGLFYRLRYTYMKILRNVGDEEMASASWPYFKYIHGLDLKAFPCRKSFELKKKKKMGIKVSIRQKSEQIRNLSKRSKRKGAQTKLKKNKSPVNDKTEEQTSERNQNHVFEYSDGQTSGSDIEAVENKRKKLESV